MVVSGTINVHVHIHDVTEPVLHLLVGAYMQELLLGVIKVISVYNREMFLTVLNFSTCTKSIKFMVYGDAKMLYKNHTPIVEPN